MPSHVPHDEDENFWGEGGKAAFLVRTRARIREGLELGVEKGWWPSFVEETLTPNAPPKIFRIRDFPENATLGHVMAKAELFPSVSIARKNGWNDSIRVGEFFVTKRKVHIKVVE